MGGGEGGLSGAIGEKREPCLLGIRTTGKGRHEENRGDMLSPALVGSLRFGYFAGAGARAGALFFIGTPPGAARLLLPPMPMTTVSIAPSAIITTVPVAGIVPRSVIGIPISRSGVAVGRSRVTICWRWVAIGSWRWIPIPWATIISMPGAADDCTEERCPCPYSRPWAPRVAWLRGGQCYHTEKKQNNQNSLFHITLPWRIAPIPKHFEQ